MRFGRAYLVALFLVALSSAQTPEDELRTKIRAVRYAPLAEQAQIQGDVHLTVKSGVITLLSGHPMLAQTAVENAKVMGSIQATTDLDAIYHFVIVDTATTVRTPIPVRRGNTFERAVLRVFGLKTEKVVFENRCQEGGSPANDLKIAGEFIEIWIYGRTRCLQTVTATLVASR
jgi:hypothetical protein